MPVIDSRHGLIMYDGKPTRVCQWHGFPRSDYTGRKMKVCARCTFVRYCSKDCQKLDWRFHREDCRTPRLMDLGGWMEAYEWLWRWAAVEALEARTGGWKILDHVLLVKVIRADRIAGQISRPFIVGSAHVVGVDEALRIAQELPLFTHHDFEKSLEIKLQGGTGLAQVLFVCPPRNRGPQAPTLFMTQKYHLREGPLRVAVGDHSAYHHMAQWEGVLKGVANGDIVMSDISRIIESPLPVSIPAAAYLDVESQLEFTEI